MYTARMIYTRCLEGYMNPMEAIRQLLNLGHNTNDSALRRVVADYVSEIKNWR